MHYSRCAGGCVTLPAPPVEWTGDLNVVFAETEGTCGPLGRLTYEVENERLGVFDCESSLFAVDDCTMAGSLLCASPAAGGELMFELDLQRTERGIWLGHALVHASEGDQSCSSSYNVWISN